MPDPIILGQSTAWHGRPWRTPSCPRTWPRPPPPSWSHPPACAGHLACTWMVPHCRPDNISVELRAFLLFKNKTKLKIEVYSGSLRRQFIICKLECFRSGRLLIEVMMFYSHDKFLGCHQLPCQHITYLGSHCCSPGSSLILQLVVGPLSRPLTHLYRSILSKDRFSRCAK